MNTKWFLIIGILAAAMLSAVSYAGPFTLHATDDISVANDPGLAADGRDNGDGLHVRNVADRRRVSFVRYDLSTISTSGNKYFYDVYLSVRSEKDHAGPVSVYGIKEACEDINFETVCWNDAPGVFNTPTPVVNSPVELDYDDITPALLTFDVEANVRTDLPINEALAEFLNQDTNNEIVLMFAETGLGTASTILRSINKSATDGVTLVGNVAAHVATHPQPANHANVATDTAQVSWVNPEPNELGGVITCDVYFGETEPNLALSNYGLTQIANDTPALSATLPYALERNKTYYWVVDAYDSTGGLARGLVWSFNTLNMRPVVTTTTQYLWLGHQITNLTAVVEDDDYPAPLTYAWRQTAGTVVTIDPNTILEPTVTLPGTGDYEFTLTANDSELEGTGKLKVLVRTDPCAAAKANTSFYQAPAGDFDADCDVDLVDFLVLAADWLKCNSLAPCI